MGSTIAPIIVATSDTSSSVWAFRNLVAGGNAVKSVTAGSGVTITGTPTDPVVNATATGVLSITPVVGTFGTGTGGIAIGGTPSAATIANTGIRSVGIAAGTTQVTASTDVSGGTVITVPSNLVTTLSSSNANCSINNTTPSAPVITVPTAAGGVTTLSTTGSSQITVTNTPGGASVLALPGNFVTSVTQASNIVVGGTSAATTVALADPINLTSGVSVTGSGTLSVSGASTLTGNVTLGAPLILATSIPTIATQLGFTRSIAWAGGTSGTALGSGTKVTYATTTISQAGVYLVNCAVYIGIGAGTTVQSAQLYYEASGVTIGAAAGHFIPYNNAVFASGTLIILPATVVTVVPVSTTSTLQVSVYGNYSAGNMTRVSSDFLFQITRIA